MSTTTTTPRRRSFLAGLAALAAPAAAATPVAAAAPAATEAPELLALGERLSACEREFDAAVARRNEAIAIYERTRPSYPPEIITGPGTLSQLARDINGDGVRWDYGPGHGIRPLNLYRSHLVASYVIGEQISRHTKAGKAWRRIARIAKTFEKEEAAARKASGVDSCDLPTVEIGKIVDEIMKKKPTTMAGVVILARAAALHEKAMSIEVSWHHPRPSDHAVEALLRVVQEGGAREC